MADPEAGLTKWHPDRPDLAPPGASQASSVAEAAAQTPSVADVEIAAPPNVLMSFPQHALDAGGNDVQLLWTPFQCGTETTHAPKSSSGTSSTSPPAMIELAILETLNTDLGQFKSHWDWLSS